MFSIVGGLLFLLLKLLTFAGTAISATLVIYVVMLFISVTLVSNSVVFCIYGRGEFLKFLKKKGGSHFFHKKGGVSKIGGFITSY